MVIAVPTGIKIFSWLNINSFSKNYLKKLIDKLLLFINSSQEDTFNSNISENIRSNNNLLKIFPRSNINYILPNNNCKELVIYGSNLENNINCKYLTSIVRYMFGIPNNILYILTGLILSDGHINTIYKKDKDILKYKDILITNNSRFIFKQSIKNSEYLLYVFNLLSHYCRSIPKLKLDRVKGKTYNSIMFYTLSLPCFTILRKKFYKGRIKIIPNDIYDLINYESLAHIIMNNGSLNNDSGIVIHFKSYTLKELILFRNVLDIKFNLNCTLHKSKTQWVIYIKNKSTKDLYKNIYPYIISNIKHKFNSKIILT